MYEKVGYTSHCLELTQRGRGFQLPNGPVTLGGRGRITPAMRAECKTLAQQWVRLVGETLLAEFPGYDVMAAFHVFDLSGRTKKSPDDFQLQDSVEASMGRLAKFVGTDKDRLTAEMEDHLPVALQLAADHKLDSFSAWRQALLRTHSCKSLRDMRPSDALRAALVVCGAFQSASTCPVERLFSQVQSHVPQAHAGAAFEG